MLTHLSKDDHFTGKVIRKNRGQYIILSGDQRIPCSLSSRLRKKLIYPTAAPTNLHHRVKKVEEIDVIDPIAIGDMVQWLSAGDGTGVIQEVLPRRTFLSRRAAGTIPLEQVMVANVDQIVIIFAAAKPEPKWNLLDRYLVTAENANIPALICITKMDLVDEPRELTAMLQLYQEIGYPSVLTSAARNTGIDPIRNMLKNKFSLFMGKSGVGKSSLLNAIQPGLGIKIGAVSDGDIGKGKHTTTHLEMFFIDETSSVADTPGMREFSLWDIDRTQLARLFPEMRPYLDSCQFRSNCMHLHEPGCAVRRALSEGNISPRRYESYLKLFKEFSD